MKQKISKKPSWHRIVGGLKFGFILALLIAAKGTKAQSNTRPERNAQLESTIDMRDSLNYASSNLFNIAQEKYFDRIDKKYTIGRFFTKQEISELNRIFTPYLQNMAGDSDFAYKYARQNMPLRSKLPLNIFAEIIYILGVDTDELKPFGMIFNNGNLCMFADETRGRLFENFLDESIAGFLDDYDVPNYNIPEFAKIRTQYDAMLQQIDSLNNIIYRDDSTFQGRIDEFDEVRDENNVHNARYVISR